MLRVLLNRPWRAAACAFILSFALIFLLQDMGLAPFDEGLVLADADRVLHGDVVHRDFYSNYGPAAYYPLALLFRLGDHHFLIARAYGILWMAAVVAAGVGILAGRVRPQILVVFALTIVAWLVSSTFYLYPIFPCLVLALAGSALVLRWKDDGRRFRLLLAGASAGATALFRYDAGFFQAAAQGLAIVIFAVSAEPSARVKGAMRAILAYVAGIACVMVPAACLYLAVAPVSAFWADIIDYSVHYYARMRALPFPRATVFRSPVIGGVYLPFLAVLLGVRELWLRRRGNAAASGKGIDRDTAFMIVFGLLTIVLIYKGSIRVSIVQMLMAIVAGSMLLAVTVELILRRASRAWTDAVVVMFAAAAAIVPAAAGLQQRFDGPAADMRSIGAVAFAGSGRKPDVGCDARPATAMAVVGPDVEAVSHYLRSNTRPDETILVALDRHDKFLQNKVGLYFTAGRPPATHWHQFDPGLQTRADIQQKMIAELEQGHVRFVVRSSTALDSREPNGSSVSSGVYLLDRYLSASYRPVAEAGQFQIWLRRDAPAPAILPGAACSPVAIPTRPDMPRAGDIADDPRR